MDSAPTQDYHEERTDTPSDCRPGSVGVARAPVPPIDDVEMWTSVLNLHYWLERDLEFRWLQSVRRANRPEEQEASKPKVGSV